MTDTFVSAEWVADRLDDPGLAVVDVRDAWEYDGIGHLPGAVSIPFDEFRSEVGDEGMLPGTERWGDLLSTAGIDRDDEIVAYDDEHGVFAARFLVTAELYGHDPDRLHLLDGDYSAWSRGHATERDAPEPDPSDYEPTDPVAGGDSPLVDFAGVRQRLDGDADRDGDGDPDGDADRDGDTVIVDTREEWEHAEGHLPGAVQLDWLELVDADTRGLKPRGELESILADRGITPDRAVLLYCNTARRISHTYLVLRHLGYEDVLFYEGSLTEWEERGGETVSE
ncbi:sulfurtransferase [Halobaculum sp. CBA1158]|uniref:sulfurtransferase n=1 Tax=Halobaculum sp. CBA1158 TaxID=2904243 RepID=UPI001F44F42E|nr:rhodanese-like domain-containing protein [Halobaculum sp. CBA1158]UIO99808.1 sulfurtransferase [Halobaculum sp. CBA1158]